MSVPDNDLIAEVLLVSEGFNTARDLARKMVSLFQVGGRCGCQETFCPSSRVQQGAQASGLHGCCVNLRGCGIAVGNACAALG
jgi:hypothetical protein